MAPAPAAGCATSAVTGTASTPGLRSLTKSTFTGVWSRSPVARSWSTRIVTVIVAVLDPDPLELLEPELPEVELAVVATLPTSVIVPLTVRPLGSSMSTLSPTLAMLALSAARSTVATRVVDEMALTGAPGLTWSPMPAWCSPTRTAWPTNTTWVASTLPVCSRPRSACHAFTASVVSDEKWSSTVRLSP